MYGKAIRSDRRDHDKKLVDIDQIDGLQSLRRSEIMDVYSNKKLFD